MTFRTFIRTVLAFLFSLSAILPLSAELAPAEKARIEALISHIENLKDATFIRNGSDYDAKSAAKFLRGKWQSHEKEILTASDFIAKAASVSDCFARNLTSRTNVPGFSRCSRISVAMP